MRKVVIIGNGISGITAARHIRKRSDDRIVVISAESDHFFSRTALMYLYMGHMKYKHIKPYEDWFWGKNRIELQRKYVKEVKADEKKLLYSDGGEENYDVLIIASGSVPNKFGWPGQELPGVQGLYSLQDLELMEENTNGGINRAVVVGGGLIGVEMSEMLLTRKYPVTILVRENHFWGNVLPKEESLLIGRHMTVEHHVDLRTNVELKEIRAGENGRVRSVLTSTGEEIPCEFVGLTAGVSPNIGFLKGSGVDTKRGVLVNEFLETNVPGVYAIGDCAEFHRHPTGRKNIEQVWYTGRMMGEVVARTVVGERTPYAPGVWFNSAKFFDIEYQTYGWVFPRAGEGEEHFYWEQPEGKRSLRMVFGKEDRILRGVNVFGIRLRHEILDRWISNHRTVDFALEHFRDANFDTEFFKEHAPSILERFNSNYGTHIKPARRSWKRILQIN